MRLPLFVRSVVYALRGGFLVRPLLISHVLGLAGMTLSSLEESYPVVSSWVPTVLFPSRADPQIAQIMLSTVATSVMTVVSIVFAILLMTLTLASMQFSPRILVSFVRHRVTQWTLGFFLGTFLYCMAALPAARNRVAIILYAAAGLKWNSFVINGLVMQHMQHAKAFRRAA